MGAFVDATNGCWKINNKVKAVAKIVANAEKTVLQSNGFSISSPDPCVRNIEKIIKTTIPPT
jgi:hypothetical protein